jgi:hypothetical protein
MMITEEYKGYEINKLYDFQQKPFYNIAKVLDDDPYYEIWGVGYRTIDDAKKAIDNGELPHG